MGSVPKSIQILRTIFGTIVNRYFVPFMVQLRSNEGQPNFNTACCKSYIKHKGAEAVGETTQYINHQRRNEKCLKSNCLRKSNC